MGWSSAGWQIFAPVADGLIKANATDEIKREVLTPLIGALLEGDWDEPDYYLAQYKADPAIVAAFAEHGITLGGDGDDG